MNSGIAEINKIKESLLCDRILVWPRKKTEKYGHVVNYSIKHLPKNEYPTKIPMNPPVFPRRLSDVYDFRRLISL